MKDYILEYTAEKERADLLERILLRLVDENELGRAEHIHHLEDKNKALKHEVRVMQKKAEEFNRLLYATGLIARCTGCEAGKPFGGEDLTEEKIRDVEILARRLRAWWNNHCHRTGVVPAAGREG